MIYKKPAVLIVDDDKTGCDFICDGLAEEGFICEAASNGDKALATLNRQRFDVALLDIRLPGQHCYRGYEIRRIRLYR